MRAGDKERGEDMAEVMDWEGGGEEKATEEDLDGQSNHTYNCW